MLGEKRIAVIIPAYNEERLILKAVSSVPSYVDYILAVDDASVDATFERLREVDFRAGFECIRHERNLGVGGAIVTGYRRCLQLNADIAVVMAGDAQMDPNDLEPLLTPLLLNKADYSKGDRLSFPGVFKTMPLFRFVGNHILSLLTRYSSGYRQVRDSQCGYTALNKITLDKLDLDNLYLKYGFPNDILAKLHSVGARLAHVKVRPIYGEEVSGISWFTALFRVPLVLLKSYFWRKRRNSQARRAIIKTVRRV